MEISRSTAFPLTTVGSKQAAGGGDPKAKPELDEKTTSAIQEFEGMLLAQMLQSIRESALGGWQEQSDQAGATALEMAEGQMARQMAANGGLGLAKILKQSLTRNPESSQ